MADRGPMLKHGIARIPIGLLFMFPAGALALSLWNGEALVLACVPLAGVPALIGLVILIEGLSLTAEAQRVHAMHTDGGTPAWYPRGQDVEALARRAGPYMGRMGALQHGVNAGSDVIYAKQVWTGQTNQRGERVYLTIGTNHEGDIALQEYHLQDYNTGLLDRGGNNGENDPNPFDR